MKESKRVSMSCTLKSPHPLEASCPCKHVIVIRFNARVSLRRDQIDKKRTRRWRLLLSMNIVKLKKKKWNGTEIATTRNEIAKEEQLIICSVDEFFTSRNYEEFS